MSKQVILGSEARTNLVKGIDTLADAVVSTLGPNGRNVVLLMIKVYPNLLKMVLQLLSQ